MPRIISLILTVIVVALATTSTHAQSPARPNIVLFIADDMTVTDSSVYGNATIGTPAMAALAREGMTFDRAYATSPTCAPSRAALLTGQYGARSGAMFNHQPPRPDVKRWPAYFRELGYEVVAIGKVAHYEQVQEYGFDHFSSFNYHEDTCIDDAVKWLAARKSERPLCLLVGTNWPHVPWPQATAPAPTTLPAKFADTPRTRAARARYEEAVRTADRDLATVREAVAKSLPGDTLFVFSADQGAQFPFAKWNLYEAGLRVPLTIVWPGKIAAGTRTSAMVSWIDVLPTLIDAVGGDVAQVAPAIDGRSFLPVLAGQSDALRDRVFASHSGDGKFNFYPSRSVRIGQWKYIRNLDPSLEFHTHIDLAGSDTGYFASWVARSKDNKAIAELVERYHHRPAEELYDLSADADELNNLAADPKHADAVASARRALDEWMASLKDEGIATDRALRPVEKKPAPSKAAE